MVNLLNMKHAKLILLVYLFYMSCSEDKQKVKAEQIKKFAIENKIYKRGLIYFSDSTKSTKSITYPNMLSFDSIGNPIYSPTCMNYVTTWVEILTSDTFKSRSNFQQNQNFNQYISSNKIFSVDNIEMPQVEKNKYKYYLLYYWNHNLSFFFGDTSMKKIYSIMNTANDIAEKHKIKILYIHYP